MLKRNNDGSTGEALVPVPVSGQPGVFEAVPPFNIAFAPYWENVKLFSLERKDQFRVGPHPPLNSTVYAAAFLMAV